MATDLKSKGARHQFFVVNGDGATSRRRGLGSNASAQCAVCG
jgi:hypothetical protein